MNKKILLLSALAFAGNSFAADQYDPWYVGARIGAAHYIDFENSVSTVKNNDDLAGGFYLGYNLADFFAIEAAYTYLGEVSLDDGEITVQTLDVVGKFTKSATDSLDLFVKGGAGAHFTEGSGGPVNGLDDISPNITVGVGTEYHFTDSLSTRLEYQLYRNLRLGDEGYRADFDTHLLSLGLTYSWGAKPVVIAKPAPAPAPVVVPVVVAPVVVAEPVVIPEPIVVPVETKVVNQTAEIYFENNSEQMSASSVQALKPIIEHLTQYPESKLVLVGHTDSRGKEAYNQTLSEHRAQAVSKFLMKEYSISADRISTSGAGELEPIATNKTKEGRAENRRVSAYSPSLTVIVE